MQNQNTKYQFLTEEACSALGLSYEELKEKYKDYPHCLMSYIEKGTCEPAIEVRFEEQLATISLTFDENKNCDGAFLFYDDLNDENLFIEYLNVFSRYDFKENSWLLSDYCLKFKSFIYNRAFYFRK